MDVRTQQLQVIIYYSNYLHDKTTIDNVIGELNEKNWSLSFEIYDQLKPLKFSI